MGVVLSLAACLYGLCGSTLAVEVGVAPPVNCRETPAARAAFENIHHTVQAQGMALKATCYPGGAGWVVQLRVTDGVKASKVVRGPLADGYDVDMGTPAGLQVTGASSAFSGFSPDVHHNRMWLQALMARNQFDNLPDAWWHFAHRGAAPPRVAETDVAAR
jgi:D-alanyl-D-alanine dipeptidase